MEDENSLKTNPPTSGQSAPGTSLPNQGAGVDVSKTSDSAATNVKVNVAEPVDGQSPADLESLPNANLTPRSEPNDVITIEAARPESTPSRPTELKSIITPKNKISARWKPSLAVIAIALLGALGWLWFGRMTYSGEQVDQNGQITSTSISLFGLDKSSLLAVDGAQQLTINGNLRVNNAFVISPSSTPANPTKGQLYSNKDDNQIYYFDGTRFINLLEASQAGSGTSLQSQAVTSLGGAKGDITLGSGLTLNGGQLSATPNAGVSSLQGQTGALTLTPGSGIGVNGTQISNTGVLSLSGLTGALTVQGTPNQITVSASGNDLILSTAQDINTGANPTFAGLTLSGYGPGQVLVGNGGSTLLGVAPTAGAQCLVSTSATAVTFGSCVGGPSAATIELNNLSNVAINTALLPGSATIDLGSGVEPFRDLYLGGTATNNFRITGTATAQRVITLPNETGTICTTGSVCSGYAPGSSTSYIQNQAATFQVANFQIQSSAAGNVGGTIKGATGQTADLLQVQSDAIANPVLSIGAGGVAIFRNAANSTRAFSIQNANGSTVLGVDTTPLNDMISNRSFETDTSGWSADGGATITRTTSQQYIGSASLQVVTTAINQGAKYVTGNTFPTQLAANSTYTISWYDKLDAASTTFSAVTATYAVDGTTEVNCDPLTLNTPAVSKTGWTRHTCNIVTDATAPSATAYLAIKQADSTARTFYIDAVQVELGSSATAFRNFAIALNGVVNSPLTLTNQSDSTTALQLQSADGSALLVADTLNNKLLATNIIPLEAGVPSGTKKILLDSGLGTALTAFPGGFASAQINKLGTDHFASVTYYDQKNSNLKFIRCTNDSCSGQDTSAPSPVTLDTGNGQIAASTNDVGRFGSMALDNLDRPKISYRESTHGYLKYIFCPNPECSGSITSTNLDMSGGLTGRLSQLAIGPDGMARIIFEDANATLSFIRCLTNDCGPGNRTASIPLGTGNIAGGYNNSSTAIAFGNDGYPRIAYYDSSVNKPKYIRCLDDNCSNTGPVTLSGPGITDNPSADIGSSLSMTIGSDGNARFAYYANTTNKRLRFLRCTDAACTPALNIAKVLDPLNRGQAASIKLDSLGNPRISYRSLIGSNYSLYYVKCDDANCAASSTPAKIDGDVQVTGSSVAIGPGDITHVAYNDGSTGKFYYTSLYSGTGGDVIAGGSTLGTSAIPFSWLSTNHIDLQGGMIIDNNGRSSPAIAVTGGGTFIDGEDVEGNTILHASDTNFRYTATTFRNDSFTINSLDPNTKVFTTLFQADTENNRIGINNTDPQFALDVTGDINASSTLKIGGVTVCDNTGCNASGSGGIQNGTTIQDANFAISSKAATGLTPDLTTPTAVIQRATGQTGNLLQIQDETGTGMLMTISANGDIYAAGSLTVGKPGPAGSDGSVVFQNSVGANTVSLQAPTTNPTSNLILRLPNADGNIADCLKTDGSGSLQFAACTGGPGGGVTSLNGQTGVVNVTNGGGLVVTPGGGNVSIGLSSTGVTAGTYGSSSGVPAIIVDAQGRITSAGNVTLGNAGLQNSSITLGNGTNITGGGAVALGSSITLSVANSPTFSGTLAVQGASVTIGTSSQQGTLVLNDGSGQAGTIQTPTLSQNTTYTLPDPGVASATICVLYSGTNSNCAGSGNSITGTGSIGRISMFTGTQAIGSSWLIQNGSTLEIDSTRNLSLLGGNLNVTGTGTFSGALDVQGSTTTIGTSSLTGALVLNDGSSNTGTILAAALGQNSTYTLPDPGAASDTICLYALGNCSGLAGSGSTDRIPVFTGTGSIGDSWLLQNGSTLEVDSGTNLSLLGGDLSVTGNGSYSGTLNVQGASATIGTTSQQGSLVVNDGSSNTGTLTTAALGQNTTYTLPDPGVGNATLCVLYSGTSSNCSGSGGGITGSGTAGNLAKFSTANTITDSIITESGSNISIQGTAAITGASSLTLGTVSSLSGGIVFNGQGGGSVTLQAPTFAITSYNLKLPTVQGSISSVLQNDGSGNLSWITGSSLGCTTCIIQAPTNTAQNTITPTVNSVVGLTVNGTSGTPATAVNIIQGGDAANLSLLNTASTSGSLLSVTHSTSAFAGTALLVNVASGSGSANGYLLDLQNNGVSQFKVDTAGTVTMAGALVTTSATIGTTSISGTLFVSGTNKFTATSGLPGDPSLSSNVSLSTTTTGTTNVGPVIGFSGDLGSGSGSPWLYGAIKGAKENNTINDPSGYLAFFTEKSGGFGTLNERMRITSTGTVGIGTTDPQSSMLRVEQASTSSTAPAAYILNSSTTSGGYGLTVNNANTNANGAAIQIIGTAAAATARGLDVTGITTGTAIAANSITSGTVLSATGVTSGTVVSATALTGGNGLVLGGIALTTGSGLQFNTTSNVATTGNAINITGTAGAITQNYTGAYINIAPVRTMTAAATRTDTGQLINAVRTDTTNGASSVYNVNGSLASLQGSYSTGASGGALTINGSILDLSSNCTVIAGSCIDTSKILNIAQNYASSTGVVMNVAGAGTGNLAVLDTTNSSANGVSIDVQSSSSSQYALDVRSNNGTSRLYVRADGRVGVGTTAPSGVIDIRQLQNGDTTIYAKRATDSSPTGKFLQLQDAANADLASIDIAGNLTVKNAIINGTITVNGHIITANTSGSTTIATGAGADCGGTATVSLAGNDTSGTVTITTPVAGICVAGVLGTVTFANAFGAAPRIVMTPAGPNATLLQYYNNSSTTTTFTIDSNNAPALNTIYKYNYQVLQ